ncbi:MAG TPA: DUF4145 domain-containing protein [Bacteroidota bacterium]|nr:DUF4145 domain-containing protein [Bacteroidota bacterium]
MIKNVCPHCGTHFSRALDPGVATPRPNNAGQGIPVTVRKDPRFAWLATAHWGDTTRVGLGGEEGYKIEARICPKCGKVSVDLLCFKRAESGADELIKTTAIKPTERERPVPAEVPEAIAQDYREASRIAALSLKGAATLLRRCLQATLRHSYPDMPKGDLFREIIWVAENSILPDQVKAALHALRKVGKFGAHPADDGLTVIYELSAEDLDACFLVLDYLFELLYVDPVRKSTKLASLIARMFPQKKSDTPSA